MSDDFLRIMSSLVQHYDIVLLDTGTGISNVIFAVSLASEVVVVATSEPTPLTDAYAITKMLVGQQKRQNTRIVISQAARFVDGRTITLQLAVQHSFCSFPNPLNRTHCEVFLSSVLDIFKSGPCQAAGAPPSDSLARLERHRKNAFIMA